MASANSRVLEVSQPPQSPISSVSSAGDCCFVRWGLRTKPSKTGIMDKDAAGTMNSANLTSVNSAKIAEMNKNSASKSPEKSSAPKLCQDTDEVLPTLFYPEDEDGKKNEEDEDGKKNEENEDGEKNEENEDLVSDGGYVEIGGVEEADNVNNNEPDEIPNSRDEGGNPKSRAPNDTPGYDTPGEEARPKVKEPKEKSKVLITIEGSNPKLKKKDLSLKKGSSKKGAGTTPPVGSVPNYDIFSDEEEILAKAKVISQKRQEARRLAETSKEAGDIAASMEAPCLKSQPKEARLEGYKSSSEELKLSLKDSKPLKEESSGSRNHMEVLLKKLKELEDKIEAGGSCEGKNQVELYQNYNLISGSLKFFNKGVFEDGDRDWTTKEQSDFFDTAIATLDIDPELAMAAYASAKADVLKYSPGYVKDLTYYLPNAQSSLQKSIIKSTNSFASIFENLSGVQSLGTVACARHLCMFKNLVHQELSLVSPPRAAGVKQWKKFSPKDDDYWDEEDDEAASDLKDVKALYAECYWKLFAAKAKEHASVFKNGKIYQAFLNHQSGSLTDELRWRFFEQDISSLTGKHKHSSASSCLLVIKDVVKEFEKASNPKEGSAAYLHLATYIKKLLSVRYCFQKQNPGSANTVEPVIISALRWVKSTYYLLDWQIMRGIPGYFENSDDVSSPKICEGGLWQVCITVLLRLDPDGEERLVWNSKSLASTGGGSGNNSNNNSGHNQKFKNNSNKKWSAKEWEEWNKAQGSNKGGPEIGEMDGGTDSQNNDKWDWSKNNWSNNNWSKGGGNKNSGYKNSESKDKWDWVKKKTEIQPLTDEQKSGASFVDLDHYKITGRILDNGCRQATICYRDIDNVPSGSKFPRGPTENGSVVASIRDIAPFCVLDMGKQIYGCPEISDSVKEPFKGVFCKAGPACSASHPLLDKQTLQKLSESSEVVNAMKIAPEEQEEILSKLTDSKNKRVQKLVQSVKKTPVDHRGRSEVNWDIQNDSELKKGGPYKYRGALIKLPFAGNTKQEAGVSKIRTPILRLNELVDSFPTSNDKAGETVKGYF